MNITLEMVDNVIERTGCTYKVAKAALEKHEGDVLKAIVDIEEADKETKDQEEPTSSSTSDDIISKLKEIVNLGIVNKIVFEKDGKEVLNVPVMAGAVSAVVFAFPTITAILAAVALGCEIIIEKEDGEVINLNDMTKQTINNFSSKMQGAKQTETTVDEDHEDVTEDVADEEVIIVEAVDAVEEDEIVVEAKDME